MAAIAFFPFRFMDIPQVGCAFTSRRGGVSEPPHDSAPPPPPPPPTSRST